jgi:hypothetical protein
MEEIPQTQFPPVQQSVQNSRNGKRFLGYFLLIMLVATAAALGYLYYTTNQKLKAEQRKVADYKQAAIYTKELAAVVSDKIYRQFTLVDQNGHGIATNTCGQIVAALNYQDTKPEYRRLVEDGSCDPHSDVFKPNYSAFTPLLKEKAAKINEIFSRQGDGIVDNFDGKPENNYIKDAYPGYNGSNDN